MKEEMFGIEKREYKITNDNEGRAIYECVAKRLEMGGIRRNWRRPLLMDLLDLILKLQII